MSLLYKLFAVSIVLMATKNISAQTLFSGTIIDAYSKEAVASASIHCIRLTCTHGCRSTSSGHFELNRGNCDTFLISCIGYSDQRITITNLKKIIELNPSQSMLQKVVVSAN